VKIFTLAFLTLALLSFRSPVQAQWVEVNGHTGGYVSALAVSGNSLFEGTRHGVYMYANNGTGWKTVNVGLSNMSVQSLAVSPNGPNIFAGTSGDGVYRSTDNGTNWTAVNTGLASGAVTALAVSTERERATNLYAAISGGGVFRSTDYGTTWTAIDSGLTSTRVSSFAVSPNGTGGTDLFAGTSYDGLFRSSNNGANWKAFNLGLTSNNVSSLAVSGVNIFMGTGFGVYVSTDDGASWMPLTSGVHPGGVSSLVMVPNGTGGSNLFAAATAGGVFLSTNNGTSWTAVDSGLTSIVGSLAVSPNAAGGTNLFAGTYGGGVFVSTNDGVTWTATDPDLTFDMTSTNVRALVATPNGAGGTNLFAGTDDNVELGKTGRNGVFLSTNGGTSWTATGMTNISVSALAVSPNGAGGTDLLAGTLRGGVFISTNNGTSWGAVNVGFPRTSYDTAAYTPVTALAVSPNGAGGTNLFAGTAGDGVFISTNNGTSWGAVNAGLPRSFDTAAYPPVTALAVSPNGAGGTNLFAGTASYFPNPANGVYLSTNNGASWTATGLTNGYVNCLAVSPNGVGGTNLFAGTGGAFGNPAANGVFLSTNNGASWTAVSTGLDSSWVFAFAISPNGASGTNLFAGTSYGVFLSTNNGTSWTPANAGLPDYFTAYGWITAFAVIPNGSGATNLFAATNVNGVWRRPLSEMINSVRLSLGEIPAHFTLKQNYPNPFNPSTNIIFELPKSSVVRLSVFDILGREVSVLVNERKDAGVHQVKFDGLNLASGVYFYRLQAGDFVQSKKLMILK
jgi:hypothetical protein